MKTNSENLQNMWHQIARGYPRNSQPFQLTNTSSKYVITNTKLINNSRND